MFETQIPSSRQDEKNKLKDGFLSLNQTDLIKHIKALKTEKEQLTDDLKDINLQLEAIIDASHELFEEWKIETIRTADGYLSTGHDIYCSVTNRDEAIRWLRGNDLEGILKMDFSWQTMNAAIKERTQNGLNLPEESNGIKIYLKPKITFRK